MAISRRQMQSLFLKDADRQRQLKEEAKKRQHEALTMTDRLATGALGAVAGFATGGPVGAISGGAKGLTSGKKGLEPLVQSAVSGYAGGQAAGGKGLEALTDPTKAPDILESAVGDPTKALQRIGAKAEKKKEIERAAKAEQKKAEREQGFKKELEKIRQTGATELQKLRGEQQQELEGLKTTKKKEAAKLEKTKEDYSFTAAGNADAFVSDIGDKLLKLTDLAEIEQSEPIVLDQINKKIREVNADANLTPQQKNIINKKYYDFKNLVVKTVKKAMLSGDQSNQSVVLKQAGIGE